MNKENILTYWNIQRDIRTISEDAFKTDKQASEMLNVYILLEYEYISFMNTINTNEVNNTN